MLIKTKVRHKIIKKWTINIALLILSIAVSIPSLGKAKHIESEINDDIKIRLTGRFMHDTLINSSLEEADETQDDWRRARLGLRTNIGKDWRFRVSTDFPDGDAELRDLRVDYRGWSVHITAGQIQEPFGISETSNSNHLVLMERPLATVIGPDYSTGIQANTRGKNWGVSIGTFGPDIAGIELTNNDRNNDRAITARGTWKAIRNDSLLIHLGASASRRKPETNRGVRFNSRPETILISGVNISHPRILDAENHNLGGLEFALRHGPRLLQAEYIMSNINRSTTDDANFNGFYMQASWALTGEKRRYRTRNGSFSGITPRKELKSVDSGFWKTGAWEIAMRYSTLNVRDADVDLDGDIDGEQGDVFSIGMNWYPTANARIMLNASRITEESGRNTDNETLVQMRAQISYYPQSG